MRLFLLGKRRSLTHWLEEAAASFRAEEHEVRLGIVRNPLLNEALERALAPMTAAMIAARVARFDPDIVLAIGGLHVPSPVLEAIDALPSRPPLVGWVGDAFTEDARALAALYDLVAYTDSGLVARHRAFGFASSTMFAAHAVDPHARVIPAARCGRMVFVATPTPARRAIVGAIAAPVTLYGRGWPRQGIHRVHSGRVPPTALLPIYARHLASLNIRNEVNVLGGLNQRNFQPYLAATPLVTDDQPDLPLCFEPGREALVWRDTDELNDVYARLRRSPQAAATVGEAGRRRVLAEHTYGHRLAAFARQV